MKKSELRDLIKEEIQKEYKNCMYNDILNSLPEEIRNIKTDSKNRDMKKIMSNLESAVERFASGKI